MSDEETVVPETADNLSDYELYINDEWVNRQRTIPLQRVVLWDVCCRSG